MLGAGRHLDHRIALWIEGERGDVRPAPRVSRPACWVALPGGLGTTPYVRGAVWTLSRPSGRTGRRLGRAAGVHPDDLGEALPTQVAKDSWQCRSRKGVLRRCCARPARSPQQRLSRVYGRPGPAG